MTEPTVTVDTRQFTSGTAHHAWLTLPDGATVAYLHYLWKPDQDYPLTLCDVEVRDGYRRHGHARTLIDRVRALHDGQPMWTTGSYSPQGYGAFSKHLPVLPGGKAAVTEGSDMRFVDDWDTRTARYPL